MPFIPNVIITLNNSYMSIETLGMVGEPIFRHTTPYSLPGYKKYSNPHIAVSSKLLREVLYKGEVQMSQYSCGFHVSVPRVASRC